MAISTPSSRVQEEILARQKQREDSKATFRNEEPPKKEEQPLFKKGVSLTSFEQPEGTKMLSDCVSSIKIKKDLAIKVFDLSSYTEDQIIRIPEVNPFYMPNAKALYELAYAIEYTNKPIALTGKPSVGKSSLVEYYCAITNRPFYRINYNGTMDSSSILGTQSATGGSTHWHDGVLTEGIQCPNAIVLHDEWTVAPPEVVMAMQYLLEDNGKLILTDKPGTAKEKTIIPVTNVRQVFADNTRGAGDVTGRYVATQPQNSATLDRIGTFIEIDFLPSAEEIKVIAKRYTNATNKLISGCVNVANLCRTAFSQGGLNTIMSHRVLCSWVEHAVNLEDLDRALEIAFLARMDSESEKQAVHGFMKTVFGSSRE